MNIEATRKNIEAEETRSAWSRGVKEYALELLENVEQCGYEITDKRQITAAALNGADNWTQYSYGGCSFIYDGDIAAALCTPSELKKKRGGELPPNSRETWLDVQARALRIACNKLIRNAVFE